jgi:ABC-type sugar transport system substrate-binding protein
MSHRLLLAAALCATALLAALAQPASAADAATVTVTGKSKTPPDRPRTRTGAYKIASRGDQLTRARCTEGGNVIVPTHANATAEQRDHDLREACKNIDYTK